MAPFTESTLELAPDSKFVYFDSGGPPADQPYTTYIFVHGAFFSHKIWTQMLSCVPSNTRVLAHSTRGYKGSSPFPSDATDDQLRDLIGRDLAAVVSGFINRLSLLSNPGSKVKLLTWSIGVCSLLSAYNLCGQGKLDPQHEKALREQVSEISIFEGPSTLGLGVPPSASTQAFRAVASTLTPGGLFIAGIRQVTGIYDYHQTVLDDVEKSFPTMDVVFHAKTCLADDDEFMAIITPLLEPEPLRYYIQAKTPESIGGSFDVGKQYVNTALKAMLQAPAVKKIKALTTKHTVPDCLEGPALLMGMLRLLERELKIEKRGFRFIEGEYNHFVLVQAPEALWKGIMSREPRTM